MNLDSAQIRVRPRNHWEGIDLGFAMARRWFLPLWLLWWAGALPVYLLLRMIPWGDAEWLLLVLVWWGKPLYEPPLLFWLSRAAFDERLPLRTVLRQWPRIVRPRLLMNLTLARFAAARSFRMPVALLEGLRGADRNKRLATLERRESAGTWLTLVVVHFEMALQLSFFTLLVVMIPEELRWFDTEAGIFTLDPVIAKLQEVLSLLAMSLLAPFYVAGGFALYLTRRTQLEAWDVELSFRRIAERLRRERSGGRGVKGLQAALFVVLLGGIGGLSLAPAQAQATRIPPDQAERIIGEVLAGEEFGAMEERAVWRFVGDEEGTGKAESNPILERLGEFLRGLFSFLANAGEIILWLAAGLVAGYLIHWAMRNRGWLAAKVARGPKPSAQPVEICGLDIRPEGLPEDIVGAALRLVNGGDPRAALSLLYRGALARFVHRDQLAIPVGATEGECLRLVERERPAPERELFAGLTALWLRLAYGHEAPPAGQVERVCVRWREVFVDGESR